MNQILFASTNEELEGREMEENGKSESCALVL
jgi:hypothetical protein